MTGYDAEPVLDGFEIGNPGIAFDHDLELEHTAHGCGWAAVYYSDTTLAELIGDALAHMVDEHAGELVPDAE